MAKHGHIHTRFNTHSKGTSSPIHKGYQCATIFFNKVALSLIQIIDQCLVSLGSSICMKAFNSLTNCGYVSTC